MNNSKMHHISRNKRANLWSVRITRAGVKRSKAFSDSKATINSPVFSLIRAVSWRDAALNMPMSKFRNL